MQERIAEPERASPNGVESNLVKRVRKFGAASHLVMDERGVRRIDDSQARAPHLQANVEVIVDDRMALVESTDLFERGASHKDAGAGHGSDIALRGGDPKRTNLVAFTKAECMTCVAFDQV